MSVLSYELREALLRFLPLVFQCSNAAAQPFLLLLDRFPEINVNTLQDPVNVAKAVKAVLLLPEQTGIPEIMVLPMQESSWP